MLPFVFNQRKQAVDNWKMYWREVLAVGILCPLSYLVLIAMTFCPVSYVAPTREVSILIGAFLGSRFLEEGATRRRMIGAGAMVTGIFALALG